jgi:hypothetical protein
LRKHDAPLPKAPCSPTSPPDSNIFMISKLG